MKTNPPCDPTPSQPQARRTCSSGSNRPALERTVRALGGMLGPTRDFTTPGDYIDRLRATETAPFVTHRTWLERHGLIFAPPQTLSFTNLPIELLRLINALAFARVFLSCTDHLSDEALYVRLWNEVLEADEPDVPRYEDEASHWDLSQPGSDPHVIWLTYYASEEERAEWAEDFPEQPLPPSRPCLFDRDSTLPQPYH